METASHNASAIIGNVYSSAGVGIEVMAETERWQQTWHGLQDILGPKWTFHILRLLSEDPRGFNAIVDELEGLTAPMCSQRLKELTCHGLVERTVTDTTPPTTTYALTGPGAEIAGHLQQLESLVELTERPERATHSEDCTSSTECRTEALTDGCVTVVDRC